jgi:hypothetical protein
MKLMLTTAGVIATMMLAGSAPARADVRVGVGIQIGPGYRAYPGTFRYGYDRGVDEGYREGERDARRHERFAFRDERGYRDADRGYRGWMGPRYEYARGYQRGYEEGYARAYRRYARYDRYDRRDRW